MISQHERKVQKLELKVKPLKFVYLKIFFTPSSLDVANERRKTEIEKIQS